MLKPAKVMNEKNMVLRQYKIQSPKMAKNADLARDSARLSSAHRYQLIRTCKFF
jgi:hypothetical protein